MKITVLSFLILLTFNSFGATYYCDPATGVITNDGSINSPWSTLEDVIAAGYIESYEYAVKPYDPLNNTLVIKNSGAPITRGDTIVLREGLHGEIFLRAYNNDKLITILGEGSQNSILKSIHIQGGKHWKFENLGVSSEPYGDYINSRLVYFESHGFHGPCSHVDIVDCDVFSSAEPWQTESDWLDNVSSGIYMRGDSMRAINNRVSNIDHGITAYGDYIDVERNSVINFSGDGMRVLGSYINFISNLIKNCYDVDDNHDDGIQSFTTNGIVVDNNNIISNTIINTDDLSRPLNGPLQGIGCFDGIYNNWLIANNMIYVDHWHGITLLGAYNCAIINNTVIDPTPDITSGASWIRIDDDKDGTPSVDCIVKNNVTNQLVVDAEVGNNIIVDTYDAYEANFVDYRNFNFNLIATSEFIDVADASVAPVFDISGYDRFIDGGPDVGAYEYRLPVSVNDAESTEMAIYPNPFSSFIYVDEKQSVDLYSLYGVLIQVLQPGSNDVSSIPSGVYVVKYRDLNRTVSSIQVLIKN